jgi:hypothetical protein
MSSQWERHKQGSWSQREWDEHSWSVRKDQLPGTQLPGNEWPSKSDMEDVYEHQEKKTWQPSLRIDFVPVKETAAKLVRHKSPVVLKPPMPWGAPRWEACVEQMTKIPLMSIPDADLSGRLAPFVKTKVFETNYGPQKVNYRPGEGSRLNQEHGNCYFENYELAPWEDTFTHEGQIHTLPRNNLDLEHFALASMFENPVNQRHRQVSASRERRNVEKEPGTEAVGVLNQYWLKHEAPYVKGVIPPVLNDREAILDLDLLYDNSPHDGVDTPFQPGTKTTWCTNYLLGVCPYGKLCGSRHGQVIVKCIDYLVAGLIEGEAGKCPYGNMCPWQAHGGHTPFESPIREVGSRPFKKKEADAYKKVQHSNTWPENVFPIGYWRGDAWKDQWIWHQPHLYYLSGIGGTRWPHISWKNSNKVCPPTHKVAPLIFDSDGKLRPQFVWTIPPHIGPKPSAILKGGWTISGTQGSLTRFVYDASMHHQEGELLKKLEYCPKMDPPDDAGGVVKNYFTNPPPAVAKFLNAKNAVHLPDATEADIVQKERSTRRRVRVMQLPGTIGLSGISSETLDYPNVPKGDLSAEEQAVFSAYPMFLQGTNVAINYPVQSTLAQLIYIFQKGRFRGELSQAAKARTQREHEFGETVAPFEGREWTTK